MADVFMGFEGALEILKAGGRVQRRGWDDKGMWLVLVCDLSGMRGNVLVGYYLNVGPESHDWLYTSKHLPWIGIRTADGGFVPWTASQTDLLADDWEPCP